eukprot:1157578-Pelagomonas_calceolata.AAC.10
MRCACSEARGTIIGFTFEACNTQTRVTHESTHTQPRTRFVLLAAPALALRCSALRCERLSSAAKRRIKRRQGVIGQQKLRRGAGTGPHQNPSELAAEARPECKQNSSFEYPTFSLCSPFPPPLFPHDCVP